MQLKPFSIDWFLCKIIKIIQLLFLIILINLSLLNDYNNDGGIITMCNAAAAAATAIPLSSPLEIDATTDDDQHQVALKRVAVATITATTDTASNGVNNLTRQHDGDVFNANNGKFYSFFFFLFKQFFCYLLFYI